MLGFTWALIINISELYNHGLINYSCCMYPAILSIQPILLQNSHKPQLAGEFTAFSEILIKRFKRLYAIELLLERHTLEILTDKPLGQPNSWRKIDMGVLSHANTIWPSSLKDRGFQEHSRWILKNDWQTFAKPKTKRWQKKAPNVTFNYCLINTIASISQ